MTALRLSDSKKTTRVRWLLLLTLFHRRDTGISFFPPISELESTAARPPSVRTAGRAPPGSPVVGGEVATAAVAARPSAAPPAAEARPTPERVEGRRAEAAPRAWNVPSAGCQLTPGRRLRAGRCEGEAVAPQGPSPSPSPSPPLNPLPPAGLSAQGRSPRRGRSLRRGRFPARAASARPPAPRRPSPPRCSCASCSGS